MGIPRQTTKIVHLAIYHGKTEFYSGIGHGSLVWLTEDVSLYDSNHRDQWGQRLNRRYAHVSLSVQGLYQDTGHLSVYDPNDVEVLA